MRRGNTGSEIQEKAFEYRLCLACMESCEERSMWMRRFLATLLTLAMALGLFVPEVFAQASKSPITSVNPRGAAAELTLGPRDKISKEVAEAFSKDEFVRYIVLLNDRADVFGAADSAKRSAAAKGVTGKDLKAVAGAAVVRSLRETASRSQGDLLKAIRELQAAGAVRAYQPFWIINAVSVTSTKEAMEALAKIPQVKSIILDVKRQYIPPNERPTGGSESSDINPAGESAGSTPPAGSQSAGAQNVEWNVQHVEAPAVWAMGYRGQGTVVANLDTGVDGTHPALARKWRGIDPETGQPGELAIFSWFDPVNGRSFPYDDHGHGTHTMGTICGSDPEGVNQIGVAPDAQWIAVKILDASGSGYDTDIIAGGQWLVAPTDAQGQPHPEYAPDVVNNSWGAGPIQDDWFRDVVNAWRAAGIFPAFSAGNSGPGAGTIGCPGNYPESFAVGAIDRNNVLAGFSSRGPSPYGEIKPEVVAPGVGVRSSVPGGYEGGWSGTSMACPHVAGTVALLRSIDPGITVDQLESLLTQTATPLEDNQYQGRPNNGFGWGLVNAYNAMLALIGSGTVAGKVLQSGDDLEPPVVEHYPITEAFVGFDLPVTVRARDDVSVVSVELLARIQGEPAFTYVQMDRISGDHKDGVYQGIIPWYLFQENLNVEYFIRVRDFGGNVVRLPEVDGQYYVIQVKVGVEPGYAEDFEGNSVPAGWVHGGSLDCWEWGVPASGPGAAHSGQKLFATNLSGNYPSNANCYLLMPPLDLRNVDKAILRFWHWYELETGYDYGDVYVSLDGMNFFRIQEFTGSSGGWKKVRLDLTPFTGHLVYLLFNLFTDGSVTKAGWYIDDVALIGPDDIPPEAPTGLTAQDTGLGTVQLTWAGSPEEDVQTYDVYHRVYDTVYGAVYGDFTKIASTTLLSFIHGDPVPNMINQYGVKAVDLGGNESPMSNIAEVTPVGPVTVFEDNFETGAPGWTHGGTGDCWQLGMPTSGPGNAHSGANLWATNLAGNYGNNMDGWLMSPQISLPEGFGGYVVTFWHWYEIETGYDKGFVEISRDGTTWTTLGQYSHSTNGKAWSQATYDLDAATYGGQTVYIRFRLKSDSSVVKQGWYIDDVEVLALPANPDSGSGTDIIGGTISGPDMTAGETLSLTPGDPDPSKEKPNRELLPSFKWEDVRTGEPGSGMIVPEEAPPADVQSLPLDAVVTILETGRSTRTNPATGDYSISHAPGNYTISVYSYGFYPAQDSVTIEEGVTTRKNFVLQPIPRSVVAGVVIDKNTGQPIQGAELSLVEDPYVAPALTDQNGQFSIDCFIGEYTLHISAPTYYPQDIPIVVSEGAPTVVNVALKPFVGYPGELVYDDGTAENAYAFYDAGNGWAVRMTPQGGAAMLKSIAFRFWDSTWPNPGGTAFKWAVFDATGPDGAPGKMVAGPFDGTAVRDGNWTVIDCGDLGITVTGDFYVAYIQSAPYPNCPGLAVDEDGRQYGRSWQFVGGEWSPRAEDEGNTMIRASVMYPVGVPVITSPADGTVTNQLQVEIKGQTSPNVEVRLYRADEEVGRTNSDADGVFSIPVNLNDGPNVFIVKAWVGDRYTDPSQPITIHLDTEAPVLEVTEPFDGFLTNRDAVTITGTVSDRYLDKVLINEAAAPIVDGHFTLRVLLAEEDGPNTITVQALDKAQNATAITRTVTRDTQPPAISQMVPSEDVSIAPGQSIALSFQSEPGLASASYQVVISTHPQAQSFQPMHEDPDTPGLYRGTWVVPSGIIIQDAEIQFRAQDAAGNITEAFAPGKLSGPPVTELVVTTESLPKGKANQPYQATLQAQGGVGSYTWSIAQGALPQGLALAGDTGIISGTPSATGTAQFVVEVVDSLGVKAQKALSIEIGAAPPPPPPPPPPPSGGTGTATPQPATQKAEGVANPGVETIVGGGALGLTLRVLPDSLPEPAKIVVEKKTGILPGASGNRPLEGTGYEIKATSFSGKELGLLSAPVEIVTAFSGTPREDMLLARYLPGSGRWMGIPTAFNSPRNEVRGKTRHLSLFALVTFPDFVKLADIGGHWGEEYIVGLTSIGVVGGYPGGIFKPDADITRAEFVKLVVTALGLTQGDGSSVFFEDVTGHWAAPYIEVAYKAGLVKGSDDRFRPDDKITRAEMAAILGRAIGVTPSTAASSFADDAGIPGWAKGYVDALSRMQIISGRPGNLFDPAAFGTRAESAKMIWSIIK
ncbi:MAG: S8 family serine peptidase [Candidatus Fermentithermobacillus carboniphilus]|uniref:S8 family serine peptidase n=1 Tax=Candidatus Fermentithermobacillus carboniphilus TaxID=3085328 RepID=A0AAT9LE00_9FIRM|nr:MAG: S8 family serine peptidase [Candidatus Fermentithermobacillus carboniphilus]